MCCQYEMSLSNRGMSLRRADARGGGWLGHYIGKADDNEGLDHCGGTSMVVVMVVVAIATSRGSGRRKRTKSW